MILHVVRGFVLVSICGVLSHRGESQSFSPLGEEFQNCGEALEVIRETSNCYKASGSSTNLYVMPYFVFAATPSGTIDARLEQSLDGKTSRIVLLLENSPQFLRRAIVERVINTALAQNATSYQTFEVGRLLVNLVRVG
jgi:hypothetical protein